MHAELSAAMETFQAKAAAGLILDVNSGELLSMVSLPDFDPHNSNAASDFAKFNRNTLGVYEMGSTFKSFTVANALDDGVVKLTDGFDATKPIKRARFMIRDSHPEARWLTVSEIYMHSSNIGTVQIADAVGVQRQQEFLSRLGLMDSLQVELPERASPLLPASWSGISSATVSFGHGMAVTPLHLARATAALVNGGVLQPVTLLKQGNGQVPQGTRVISERTSQDMRRLMRKVVEKGTGRKADVQGYLVGGKTGTAEKASAGGYDRDAMLSSFVSAFPMNDPKYLVLVVLDEPQGTKETFGYATAGWTAAPVVSRVISRLGPMMGLVPVPEYMASEVQYVASHVAQ